MITLIKDSKSKVPLNLPQISGVRGSRPILHILDGFGIGGAETWLVAMVRYCHDNNHPLRHDFICTGGEKRIYDDELTAMGSKLYYFKYSTKALLQFRSFMIPILKKTSYSAIWNHADYISGWQFLAMKGKLPQIRIAYLHNPINQTWQYRNTFARKFIYYSGRYLTAALATHITGTSDQVMDDYGYQHWPYSKKRIEPIHCAFDVNKFIFSVAARQAVRAELGITSEQILVLFIGRLRLEVDNPYPNQKNPEFALDLARAIIPEHPAYVFVFTGDKGHTGDAMEASIRKEGLHKNILFTGSRKDIERMLCAADVMIFPSIYEGMGMVAVEAQACGLPVLMSDQVPPEAIVAQQLVQRLPLDLKVWIDALLATGINPRTETVNEKVEHSDFNIAHCVAKINRLVSRNENLVSSPAP